MFYMNHNSTITFLWTVYLIHHTQSSKLEFKGAHWSC